jgi:outer membrane immunogenic protein
VFFLIEHNQKAWLRYLSDGAGATMKLRIAGLALIASVCAAAAADVAYPTPTAAPASPAVSSAYNWSGFYVGAMGGYGSTSSQRVKGEFAGGTVGANWQMSYIVAGVEAEGAWSNIGRPSNGFTSYDAQTFGSVNGRLGVAMDNILFYGKGGFAFLSNTVEVPIFAVSGSKVQTGWDAGGGIEVGFLQNWSVKAEYLYSHYDSRDIQAGPFLIRSGDLNVHSGKIGVNYKFGWPSTPVTARY